MRYPATRRAAPGNHWARVTRRAVAISALFTLGCGSASDTDDAPPTPQQTAFCGGEGFAPSSAVIGPALYVSNTTIQVGDGSPEAPFQTVAAALGAASDGDVIYLDAGTWSEPVISGKGVSVVGCGAEHTMIAPGDSVGIGLVTELPVRVENLRVDNALGVGLQFVGGEPVMRQVLVTATRAEVSGAGEPAKYGHGIQATGGAVVRLDGVTSAQNQGLGLLASDAAAIVTGTFLVNNDRGGAQIVTGTFQPSSFTDSIVKDNSRFGVALYGVGATLDGNTIDGTKAGPGSSLTDQGGDALVVAPSGPDDVAIVEVLITATNLIIGSQRLGILTARPAVVDLQAHVVDNQRGGFWGEGNGVTLRAGSQAELRGNGGAAVAVRAQARAELLGALLADTTHIPVTSEGVPEEGADGLVASDGASVRVENATFDNNLRAGILGHAIDVSGDDFIVTGTFFEGGEFHVVLQEALGNPNEAAQKLTEDANQPEADKNSFEGAKQTNILIPDEPLGVRPSPCSQPAGEACYPPLDLVSLIAASSP